MVKPRPRKTNRGKTDVSVFEEASQTVIELKQSIRSVAKKFNIYHVSLNRFIKKKLTGETLFQQVIVHIIKFFQTCKRKSLLNIV